jgi:hypothetical protein
LQEGARRRFIIPLLPQPQEGAHSHQGGGGARVNTVNEDDSYNNNDNHIASIGHQKMGQGPNNPADRAGGGCPEMRSPKVPTRSGHGANVGTINNNVSSGRVLPIASNDKFESKERGHEPDNDNAAPAKWPHWPGG